MSSKVSIIGTGFVGSTTAYALMMGGLASRLVLVDIDRDRAEGEAMDLSHGASFVRPLDVVSGDYSDCSGSDIVIIAAGANQKPGETRLDLVYKNLDILEKILGEVGQHCRESIFLVVTNPVDVLTRSAAEQLDLPEGRVIGSGTVLDSSRFRYLIGRHCGVDPRNVHAYVLGEHGDTEVLTWSVADVAGIPLPDFCRSLGVDYSQAWKDEVDLKVRRAAYEVISKKGATYYAIGLATRRIVESILRDERSVLTVSGPVREAYGQRDVCFSLPRLVGRDGATRYFVPPVSADEEEALVDSARTLDDVYRNARFLALQR